MSEEFEELIQDFVADSNEMLDQIEPQLIELTKNGMGDPVDDQIINAIFRLFHSLKGGAGFLNFTNVQKVTHEAETLLDLVRKGNLQLTKRHINLLVRTDDFLRDLLDRITEQMSDSGFESDAKEIINNLKEAKNWRETEAEEPSKQKEEEGPVSGDTSELKLDITDEMVVNFVKETFENLDLVEQSLLNLEKNPDDQECIEEVFRNIHTIKGNCGFFGFADLEKLSHKFETVLELVREKSVNCSKDTIQTFLSTLDTMRKTVVNISDGESGNIQGINIFMEIFDDLVPLKPENVEPASKDPSVIKSPSHSLKEGESMLTSPTHDNAPPSSINSKTVEINEQRSCNDQRKGERRIGDRRGNDRRDSGRRASERQDIRVDLKKLDALMELVGELIVAEKMVTNNPDLAGYDFERFEKASLHLRKITRELQDVAMSVRMVPLSATFKKMIRLVHDLSQKNGKEVELELLGEETEVDKTVSELISDPLVHMIRNAVDHGLETPEEREIAGKDPKGTVTVEAMYEGEEVWIIVREDGRGLNRKKILDKAVKCGLVNGEGSDLPDETVFSFIFEPGFSTAEKVTDVSGRGVGMDVVRRNIEKIKGKIDVESLEGKGSKFTIRIPLTLAIIEGMLVRVGSATYTIPLLAIRESIKATPNQIINADGDEVIKLRGKFLPVVRLGDLHNITPDCTKLEDGILVVVDHQENTFCLFVDSLIGQQQTVIKGLPGYTSNVRGVSGCTILGNGDVSLIIDVGTMAKMAESREGKAYGSNGGNN